MKIIVIIFSFLLLLAAEIFRVYFIMPFPGSQESETIYTAYWLHKNINWIRIVGLLVVLISGWMIFKKNQRTPKIVFLSFLTLYAIVFFFFNFNFQADKMFYQPNTKQMADSKSNKIPLNKLIIGVELNGVAAAYPIQLIGYHHQVRDTIANVPVMVTYCTVCRTGRVFKPEINGHPENFRLVGMDHFNAMFEDHSTGSWWRQATGEAITGKLKGTILPELPSSQMSLASWLEEYPQSLILQADTIFNAEYKDLELFDNGTISSSLEKRDSASWKMKSWIVGINQNGLKKAYDWNRLVKEKIIQDSIPGLPLVITISSDTITSYVLNRNLNGRVLNFKSVNDKMIDTNTGSSWNVNGKCVEGELFGSKLSMIQSYQEFWHSWQTFHPSTLKY